MKKVFQGDGASTKVGEDIESIKKDLQKLTDKLKNLKDDSVVMLSEQFDNITTVVNDLKGKGKQEMRNNIADLYLSTRQHPLRNLIYAFTAGVIITTFLKK